MKKEHDMLQDIPGYGEWKDITIPEWGWSKNHKFRVTNHANQLCLVRVSDIAYYHDKKKEYENIARLSRCNINSPRPMDFGVCNGGKSVYMVLTWIDGTAVEDVIKTLDSKLQYELGWKAGRLLRSIHDNSSIEISSDWGCVYGNKLDETIAAYRKTGINIRHEGAILDYIERNRHLLSARPQVVRHGDFHVGNLIITPGNDIAVIDFDQCCPGDPWEEFGGIVWAVRLSKAFAKGQVAGYFSEQVPDAFFKLLALYIGEYTLGHVVHALGHRSDERMGSIMANTDFMAGMFDDYTTYIPNWYTV